MNRSDPSRHGTERQSPGNDRLPDETAPATVQPDATIDVNPFPGSQPEATVDVPGFQPPATSSGQPDATIDVNPFPGSPPQPTVEGPGFRPPATSGGQPDATIEVDGFATSPATNGKVLGSIQTRSVTYDESQEPAAFDECGQPSGNLPRKFGDYVLLEIIAQGGMGIVFKARQRSLNRTVALKMILSGQLATADQVQRFFIEAEASAQLEHPHIVAVYEVGTHQGQHFFSMAYVEGQSLADLVINGPLSSRRAAELMVNVADAIDYAHSKGIIHRDLKPANILMDEDGTPKVTDFGLAKISDANSQVTATGQIMGTPGYMPPEQASGDFDKVGPLADVYSLGAILYCLLTGRPPFQSAQILDTLKQVLECEPVAPRQLNNEISRDLENICLKCLSKAASGRYQSARELVDDLQRFLNGEPVRARPVGTLERLRRWCVRNPAIAALTAGVVVALISGSVISTYFAIAASNRAAEAERNLAQARKAVDGLYLRVSEHTLLNQPGLQTIRHELLEEALKYYEWFLVERGNDPSVREELALNHFRVGLIIEEIRTPSDALPCYHEALEIQEQLLDEQPEDAGRRRAVADTLTAIGRAAFRNSDQNRSLDAYRKALDERRILAEQTDDHEFERLLANAHMNLGLVLGATGQVEETRTQLRQAESIRRKILTYEDSPKVRRDLAQGLYNLGNLEFDSEDPMVPAEYFREAVTHFEAVLAVQPEDLNLQYSSAVCSRRHGDLLYSSNRLDEATGSYQKATNHLRLLAIRNPDVSKFKKEFAHSCRTLGELQFEQKPADSLKLLREAATAFDELAVSEPDNAAHRFELAVALRSVGELEATLESRQQARQSLARAEKLLQELVNREPDDEDFEYELEYTRELLARLP